ncbi:amidohydrolase family protein [Metallosphaera tengchongensis]|uniref:Amidohydrolase family protein n=1 Tax=Metallosphaera tengchongensis TaxID=1532350 RepID=A0A6N0NV83_9CREN|nr:amidohydrolase family protein [Metallosphaera tengchongensis]QKR00642.1 amidohydrolase family protein [Metallosphaera tengchongensis]
MKIDLHQHLGIRGVVGRETKDIFDLVVLNPAYKYSCQCCVDGFYQQYLWNKGKDYLQLGIYNPRCRVPAKVELGRQLDRGIVGIVLNPINHDFHLQDATEVYQFAEDHDLPLFVYTGRGKGNPNHLSNVLKEFKLTVVLLGSGYPNYVMEAKELMRLPNVFGDTSSLPEDMVGTFPKDKLVFGSHYPYVPLTVTADSMILENGKRVVKI